MRILHTSDWHLGKKLEGRSRLMEQEKFLFDLEKIIDEKKIDLLLISGDIYDTYNPSAEAEKLFYDSVKRVSKNGEVGVIIISGNHDNPQRLGAISNLAKDYGIVIFEKAHQIIEEGKYGKWNIFKSVEGGIFLEKNGEKIYIYTLPFPSESSLNEELNGKNFAKRINEILKSGVSKNEDKNIPTILMTHIYVAGSMGEGNAMLELGGARAISIDDLPDVDYIALGHVHKPMRFETKKAYYSGSPIEYRVTENRFDKRVFIVEIDLEKNVKIDEIELENYKPIKEYFAKGIEEAIELSEKLKEKEEWIYLNVEINSPIKNSEIKKIKENKNILEIIPKIISNIEKDDDINYSEENILDAFISFYKEENNGMEPSKNITELFLELLEDDRNETN